MYLDECTCMLSIGTCTVSGILSKLVNDQVILRFVSPELTTQRKDLKPG